MLVGSQPASLGSRQFDSSHFTQLIRAIPFIVQANKGNLGIRHSRWYLKYVRSSAIRIWKDNRDFVWVLQAANLVWLMPERNYELPKRVMSAISLGVVLADHHLGRLYLGSA